LQQLGLHILKGALFVEAQHPQVKTSKIGASLAKKEE